MTDHTELLREALKLFPDISQLLDGWHYDGSWTEWDQGVWQRVSELHQRVNAALSESALAADPASAALRMAATRLLELKNLKIKVEQAEKEGRDAQSSRAYYEEHKEQACAELSDALDHLASESAFVCVPREVEIRRRPDGSLDEVVGTGRFHLESMDANRWWIDFDGVHVWLTAKGKIIATVSDERIAASEGE